MNFRKHTLHTGLFCVLLAVSGAPSPSVSVYDNWMDLGTLSPTDGTYALPTSVIAAGNPPIYSVDGVTGYDLAGVRIYADRRLGMTINVSGNLRRVKADGSAFAGTDTRRSDDGSYELDTEYKINLYGCFRELEPPYGAGSVYRSPTSGQLTNYDSWTGWTAGGTGGNAALENDEGWLESSPDDAWTGATQTAHQSIALTVEPDQDGSLHGPAELWLATRVRRRGLQDVCGNYKQDIEVFIYVAE